MTKKGSIKENIIQYINLLTCRKNVLAFNFLVLSKLTVRFYVPAIYGQKFEALNYSSRSKN